MFTVFECGKCEHRLYVDESSGFPKKLEKIAGMSCPHCGELNEGLWRLRGRARTFRGRILVHDEWEDEENQDD